MIDNNNDNNETDQHTFSEGGIIRRLLQATFKIKKRSLIKVIAKHSDKLSDVSEIVIKASNTVTINDSDSNNSNNNNRNNRVLRVIKNFGLGLPTALISNVIIGSISFLPFENRSNRSYFNDEITPTIAGIIGGTASALLTISYEKVTNWNRVASRRSALGTIVSHALIHASLFSSYEQSKFYFHKSLVRNVHEEESIYIAATVAGMVSGITSEIVSHYLTPFEYNMKLNRKRFYIQIRRQYRLIRLQTILIQALPSSFGFLAYEFGLRNL